MSKEARPAMMNNKEKALTQANKIIKKSRRPNILIKWKN